MRWIFVITCWMALTTGSVIYELITGKNRGELVLNESIATLFALFLYEWFRGKSGVKDYEQYRREKASRGSSET